MINQKLSGRFTKIEIKHKDGTSTIHEPFDNLITDAGLDYLNNNTVATASAHCAVSSNTDTPAITDTSVLNQVGPTSSGIVPTDYTNSGGVPFWFYQMERTYSFPLGSVSGNISKIYIINTASFSGTKIVFSSALIKDGAGNPTTISVTSEDQLFITWRVRSIVNILSETGTIPISFDGVMTNVNYELKNANLGDNSTIYNPGSNIATAYSYAYFLETDVLGSITSRPAGTSVNVNAPSTEYINGTFYRDYVANLNTSQGNYPTGIGSMCFGGTSGTISRLAFQVSFNPKLPKTADKTLSLPFRISWGRA